MGMSKPVHVLQRGAEVEEIVNIAAIAVVDAQETEKRTALPTSLEEPEPVGAGA
jgi:malate dehydrogenase (oxaloacetate-decarboxylating)(NADP+)